MEGFFKCFDWFVQGGLVMYPLLFCSIFVVAIAIERFLFYRNHCGQMMTFLQTVKNSVAEGKWQEIQEECLVHDNILSRILGQGLRYRKNFDHMKESFESLTVAETTGLRNNLSYLDTIVTMAPLLGLLGTVMGMIGSFQVLDIAGSNPSVITGSVGEALIATASGLCVAVMALAVHSYFTHWLDHIITHIEQTCIMILEKNKGELL
ncbi:MotA/TolQ/ExbB proton channel family protein [Anaerosinus sp.]